MTSNTNKSFRERSLELYFRPRDGIYVIPYGIIFNGGNYLVEPFEHLPLTATPELIWEAVRKTFPGANRVVSQPTSWTEEKAWYRKAGVKKWTEFAGKARRIMSVRETEKDYIFKSHYYYRGVVTSDKETAVNVSKQATYREIVAVLRSFLEKT